MKTLIASLIAAAAIIGIAAPANAGVAAYRIQKLENGQTSKILLSDEDSVQCKEFSPGSKFAAMKVVSSTSGMVFYQYPGCYAMREKGTISLSFFDTNISQWVTSTLDESYFEKTFRFTSWPGAPEGYQGNYKRESAELMDAIIEEANSKAR